MIQEVTEVICTECWEGVPGAQLIEMSLVPVGKQLQITCIEIAFASEIGSFVDKSLIISFV